MGSGSFISGRVYPSTAYTGRFLQQLFFGGTNRHKLITSFTQTKVVKLILKPRDFKNCVLINDWRSGCE